jgi:amino acid transporter
MTAFFLTVNYTICCLALIVLRRREPARPRPFRAWGYPWTAGVVLAGAVALVVGTLVGDTVNGVAALGLLAVGLAGRAVLIPARR